MHNSDFQRKVKEAGGVDMLDEGVEEEAAAHHHHGNEVMDERTIIAIVEQVLKDDDINGDGYVDFPEFIRSQN